MPVSCGLAATVRNLGSREEVVARVTFMDPIGDVYAMDFTPTTALELAHDLLTFVRQVGVSHQ